MGKRYITGMKALMQEKDISAADMAKEFGLSPSTIESWMAGKKPYDVFISRICDMLGCTAEELMNQVEDSKMSSKKTRKTPEDIVMNMECDDQLSISEVAPLAVPASQAAETKPKKKSKKDMLAEAAEKLETGLKEDAGKEKPAPETELKAKAKAEPKKANPITKMIEKVTEKPSASPAQKKPEDTPAAAEPAKTVKKPKPASANAQKMKNIEMMQGMIGFLNAEIEKLNSAPANPKIDALAKAAEGLSDPDIDFVISMIERMKK